MKKFDKFNSIYNEFVLKNIKPLPEEPRYIDASSMLHSTEKEVIKKWREQDPEIRDKWKPVVWSGRKIPFSVGQKEIAGQQELKLDKEATQEQLPLGTPTDDSPPASSSADTKPAGQPSWFKKWQGNAQKRAQAMVRKPGPGLTALAALGGYDITSSEEPYLHPGNLDATITFLKEPGKSTTSGKLLVYSIASANNYTEFINKLRADDQEVAEEFEELYNDLAAGVTSKPIVIYDPERTQNITIRKVKNELQATIPIAP